MTLGVSGAFKVSVPAIRGNSLAGNSLGDDSGTGSGSTGLVTTGAGLGAWIAAAKFGALARASATGRQRVRATTSSRRRVAVASARRKRRGGFSGAAAGRGRAVPQVMSSTVAPFSPLSPPWAASTRGSAPERVLSSGEEREYSPASVVSPVVSLFWVVSGVLVFLVR